MLPMNARLRNPRRSLASNPISVAVSSYSPWTPLALQPKLWLDASDLTTFTSSSGLVSEWRDKSGNNYAFTQATSTSQPSIGTTTLNGLNVMSYDGVDDYLVSTAAASEWKFLHDGTEYLTGLVVQTAIPGRFVSWYTTQGAVGGVQQTGTRQVFNAANNWGILVYGAPGVIVANTVQSVGTSTSARVLTARVNPVTINTQRVTQQLDGAQPVVTNGSSGAVSTGNPYGTLHMGLQVGTTASNFVGYIAEMVFVTGSAVTNQNRQLLHNYLNAKWAVY